MKSSTQPTRAAKEGGSGIVIRTYAAPGSPAAEGRGGSLFLSRDQLAGLADAAAAETIDPVPARVPWPESAEPRSPRLRP